MKIERNTKKSNFEQILKSFERQNVGKQNKKKGFFKGLETKAFYKKAFLNIKAFESLIALAFKKR